jgi:hypothetical protein
MLVCTVSNSESEGDVCKLRIISGEFTKPNYLISNGSYSKDK